MNEIEGLVQQHGHLKILCARAADALEDWCLREMTPEEVEAALIKGRSLIMELRWVTHDVK